MSKVMGDKRSRASEPNSRRYDNDLRSKKNQRESSEVRSPSPVSLLPEPTAAEVRRAAKVVEREEARDRALGASKDKAGAKPAAPSKAKDCKNASVPSRSKPGHVEVDEEESDDEPKLISKKINRRESHTLSDSEHAPKSGTARKVAKSALKDTGKKGKEPAKSAGRRNWSPPPDDTETEPELRKVAERPKPKGPPRDKIEVPEEEPEELESPPPTKARKRPTPKPPPPQEDKFPPLPPPLVPQLATAPEPGSFKALDAEGTPATTQMDAQALVKSGKPKAVGTTRIKRAVPQSNCTLSDRK